MCLRLRKWIKTTNLQIPIYRAGNRVKSHTFLLFLPTFTHLFTALTQKRYKLLDLYLFYFESKKEGFERERKKNSGHPLFLGLCAVFCKAESFCLKRYCFFACRKKSKIAPIITTTIYPRTGYI